MAMKALRVWWKWRERFRRFEHEARLAMQWRML
jgi:hypothetical protein